MWIWIKIIIAVIFRESNETFNFCCKAVAVCYSIQGLNLSLVHSTAMSQFQSFILLMRKKYTVNFWFSLYRTLGRGCYTTFVENTHGPSQLASMALMSKKSHQESPYLNRQR